MLQSCSLSIAPEDPNVAGVVYNVSLPVLVLDCIALDETNSDRLDSTVARVN